MQTSFFLLLINCHIKTISQHALNCKRAHRHRGVYPGGTFDPPPLLTRPRFPHGITYTYTLIQSFVGNFRDTLHEFICYAIEKTCFCKYSDDFAKRTSGWAYVQIHFLVCKRDQLSASICKRVNRSVSFRLHITTAVRLHITTAVLLSAPMVVLEVQNK